MQIGKVNFTVLFGGFCDRVFIFTMFYNDFGCLFTQKLLKSCSGGPRRLWRSGSALGGSGGARGGPVRGLGGSIQSPSPSASASSSSSPSSSSSSAPSASPSSSSSSPAPIYTNSRSTAPGGRYVKYTYINCPIHMVVMKVGCCGKVLRLQLARVTHEAREGARALAPLLINSRLKGTVDRELGGNIYSFCFSNFRCLTFVQKD